MRALAYALWTVCAACFFVLVIATTIMTCVVTYNVARETWVQLRHDWMSGSRRQP